MAGVDYCNAVLHGALIGTIQTLQRVQNNAAADCASSVRSDAKPLRHRLHWSPVKQRILYKSAHSRTIKHPHHFLSCHIKPCGCARCLQSSDTSLLAQSTSKTVGTSCFKLLPRPVAGHSQSLKPMTDDPSSPSKKLVRETWTE